jgi:SUMO ligase MMS21 Smc5/6 complex component
MWIILYRDEKFHAHGPDENIISKNVQTSIFQSVNMTINLFLSHEDKILGETGVKYQIISVYMHVRQSKRKTTDNTNLIHVYATKNNGSYICVRAHASSINLLAFT